MDDTNHNDEAEEQPPDRRQSLNLGGGAGGRPTTRGSVLDDEFVSQVTSLVSEEPRTVREVHSVLGEPQGFSRDQTEYRLTQLSASGAIQSKKAGGRTSPKIFWGDDDEEL